MDAPERLAIGVSEVATQRQFTDDDVRTSRSIAGHLRKTAPELLLAPLGLGDHIDHRIAQAAALDSNITCLAFYEDLPYAARLPPSAPAERASSLRLDLTPILIQADDGSAWKRRCAQFYSSQIDQTVVEEIVSYGEPYGHGERLWVTAPSLRWFSRPTL